MISQILVIPRGILYLGIVLVVDFISFSVGNRGCLNAIDFLGSTGCWQEYPGGSTVKPMANSAYFHGWYMPSGDRPVEIVTQFLQDSFSKSRLIGNKKTLNARKRLIKAGKQILSAWHKNKVKVLSILCEIKEKSKDWNFYGIRVIALLRLALPQQIT